MKFFEERARKAEAEFLSHIRPEILELSKRPQRITLEEYKQLRGNSWEQTVLRRNVDNETLCRNALYYLDNAGVGGKLGPWDVVDTYSQALMREMVPKLVERLQEADKLLHEAHKALGLLNSMVASGESHSVESRAQVDRRGIRGCKCCRWPSKVDLCATCMEPAK
jgi:hypothetical protein